MKLYYHNEDRDIEDVNYALEFLKDVGMWFFIDLETNSKEWRDKQNHVFAVNYGFYKGLNKVHAFCFDIRNPDARDPLLFTQASRGTTRYATSTNFFSLCARWSRIWSPIT